MPRADMGDLDLVFMKQALSLAATGAEADEVPVGAVLVDRGEVVAAAHNMTNSTQNPLAHAEMLVIQQACERRQAWRLLECTLYVTLEPCPMCAGAVLQSRIKRVVYGAKQPRLGADGSWVGLLRSCGPQEGEGLDAPGLQPRCPHPFHPTLEVSSDVLGDESAALLREFFRRRRRESKQSSPGKVDPAT